ncbi:MAG: hypothetical protein WCK29_03230 [archaeon]
MFTEKKRGMNKRAESESGGTMIALLILVVFLVLVVAGLMNFFGPFKGYIHSFTDDTTKIVNTCGIKAKYPTSASFCKYEPANLGAGTEYVNCADERIANKSDADTRGKYSCPKDYASVCNTVVISGGNETTIDGESVACSELVTCANLNGRYATLTPGADATKKSSYTCSDSTKNRLVAVSAVAPQTPYCCVDPNAAP